MTKATKDETQARLRKEKARQQENKRKQQAAREAAKAEHLDAFKADIADHDRSMHSAAEHLLKALDFGASQREVAEAVDRSPAWINRIVKWAKAGYAAAGPFAAESKAKRKRVAKSVQAPEHQDERLTLGGNYPPTDLARAPAGNGSADTEIDTEARNAAMDAGTPAADDDGSIPPFMRRTAGAPPTAAALHGSGSMTVAETLLPAAEAPTDKAAAELASLRAKAAALYSIDFEKDDPTALAVTIVAATGNNKKVRKLIAALQAEIGDAPVDDKPSEAASVPSAPNGGNAEPPQSRQPRLRAHQRLAGVYQRRRL